MIDDGNATEMKEQKKERLVILVTSRSYERLGGAESCKISAAETTLCLD